MSSLPRHFALKSVSNKSYLQYVHEESELRGLMKYCGKQLVNPYTKFEVEKASIGKGYVHIRCCYNNKYWVLHSESSHYIVAAAKEKEEDVSKHSCTLFKPMQDEDNPNAFRFRHVNLNRFLHLEKESGEHQGCLVVKKSGVSDSDQDLSFSTVVNWDTLFVLPKYLAFKSNNNHYLRPAHDNTQTIYLQFVGSEKGDPGVRYEVITTPNGHVRIKNVPYGKFLILGEGDWIVLDDKNAAEDDPRTLFWPIKLGENSVALRSVANNCFCKRLTSHWKDNCLNAALDYITDEAKLEIIQMVLSRNIYDVHFHLSDARTYNERPRVLTSTFVENNNSEDQKSTMKLSYEDTTTSTWTANLNTTFGIKMVIETGVPKVTDGEVEISAEISEDYSWGETQQFKYLAEVVHDVTVRPGTKVKGSIMATTASCDVPFSYTQRDRLMNGKYVTNRYHDGVYNVENSYNFHFLAEEV